MGPRLVEVSCALLALVVVASVLFSVPDRPPWTTSVRVAARLRALLRRRRDKRDPRPAGRPIEAIACDLRRLGARFHHLPPGASYAKVEGLRRAYDDVLAESCTALGIVHLLGVLPAGEELDHERHRVEDLLWLAGLRIDETA